MAKVVSKVLLPKNRNRPRTLIVEIDGMPAATFDLLGRGSRGPGNTEFLENGSTPTGVYQGAAWRSTASQNASSYGPNGKLTLNPVSGNSLKARYFKRVDLVVHGGDLDTRPGSPWNGDLKPTHGCLRIDNDDVTTLHSLLLGASNDESMKMSVAPQVWINVQEGDVFDDSDDGMNQCSASPYSMFGSPAGVQFQRK
jgi:hypothetical protein